MLGLLDQMEAENPEDPALAPKVSIRSIKQACFALYCQCLTCCRWCLRRLGSGPVPMSSMSKSSRSSKGRMIRQFTLRNG